MSIKDYKLDDEEILWIGHPNKSVYIKEHLFSPLLIVALIWLAFDIAFIAGFFSGFSFDSKEWFLIPFFIFHLFPVWLYIGIVISSIARSNKIEYMITDKAVYEISGIFTTNCNRKSFQEILNVSVHQGFFDRNHDLGDIFVVTGTSINRNGRAVRMGINIVDIEDYMKVYKLLTKTGNDIYSDTMYPNDLRPDENHGYNAKYKK